MHGLLAIRGTNKVMKKCRHCRHYGPKELVEGPKRIDWVAFLFLLLFTAGFGLVFFHLWYHTKIAAYCSECDEVFPV